MARSNVKLFKSFVELSDQSDGIRQELQTTLGGLNHINALTVGISAVAFDLTSTLGRLTETANSGLEMINSSAQLINRHLQVQIERGEGMHTGAWIVRGMMNLVTTIFGGGNDLQCLCLLERI